MRAERKSPAAIIILIFTVFASGVVAQTNSKPETTTPTPESLKKQIVVNVTSARVRTQPNLQSETLQYAKIGTIFNVSDENKTWSQVALSGEKSGWISNSITERYSDTKRPEIFQKLAEKYLSKKDLDLTAAAEVLEFLPKAADAARTFEKGGELRLKRLLLLSRILKTIPANKQDKSPNKELLERFADEIVYSEPAGQWYVRASVFWELRNRYSKHKIAEEIAWKAAQNPLPGECEGYINCHIYMLRATQAEYLNFYPNGKYSKEALLILTNYLAPLAVDAKRKEVYYAANDTSDRAEFYRLLTELRAIVSRLAHLEKHKTLAQIQTVADGYK